MAGAVSAGAYTAGVIDYLLETLEKWQKAKDKNHALGPDHPDYDKSVPMHDVQIDVVGGSSAGGMTAAIMALGLFEGIKPINEANPDKSHNKLYDSWVNLNDHVGVPTLEQMLGSTDIERLGEVQSLLNSDPIDAIADRAMDLSGINPLPKYISPNLQVILTITSLRGVPISVNFFDKQKTVQSRDGITFEDKKEQPAHRMYVHKGIARFMVNPTPEKRSDHIVGFDPNLEPHRQLLMDCAKATGAFPLGLRARRLKNIHLKYIKDMVYQMFIGSKADEEQVKNTIDITADDDPFDFVAVDGGTINNEPFGEVIRALEENSVDEQYAIIMIDPFPNFANDKSRTYKQPSTLLDIIPSLFSAIRSQAMVKDQDMLQGLAGNHTRRMIFPKRTDDPYPIACGSLDGFGGFFSKKFRETDFELGRYNCQRFLRKHLNVALNEKGSVKIFDDWSEGDDCHNRFFIPDETGETTGYYPIIPDLGIQNMASSQYYEPYLEDSVKPKIKPSQIFRLDTLMRNRFKAVLDGAFKFNTSPTDKYSPEVHTDVNRLMEGFYNKAEQPKGSTTFLFKIGMWAWQNFVSRLIARRMAKMAIKTILLDFRERNLLEL